MKARVKRIKFGKVVSTASWTDSFVEDMRSNDVFEFEPKKISSKVCKGWYNRINGNNHWDYSYHISWLKDVQE